MPAFPQSEYAARLQRTKEQMSKRGFDLLVLADPANMNYLSGYDGWSFYVPQVLVVALNDDQPTWIGRKMDSNGARLTAWIDEQHIRWYDDEYVQSATRHPMDAIAALLQKQGHGRASIGVEMDAYYFSALAFARLQAGLPQAAFGDATLLVNWIRLRKSDAEVVCVRRAAEIVAGAMQTAVSSIAEGVRQCDAAADVFSAAIRGTERFGGDYPAMIPMMPTGRRTAAPHLSWTEEPYLRGDTVVLELAGCYQRYHAPLARTVVVGEASEDMRVLADVVTEGLQAALAVVRPGARCEEVEAAWSGSIARHGFSKESRLGYATGLNYPPDWGEHTASLRRGDQTVLEPNMVFHMIAGMWYEESGLEMSETFRVTPSGCEVLTNFPRELFVR